MRIQFSIFRISLVCITCFCFTLDAFEQDLYKTQDNNHNPFSLTDSSNSVNTRRRSIIKDDERFFKIDDTIKNRTNNFYDTLRHKADKRKLTHEILDLIIVNPPIGNGQIATESETPFIEYNDKIIRSIHFKQLQVFGPTVNDTTRQTPQLLEKAGNKLHINTSRKILKKNLLIEPGDRINAYTLADNERLLRSLPFIQDAKFIVKPTSPLSDSVDILILTKDVLALGFGLDISSTTKGKVGIWHRNLFGLGNEQENSILWNSDEKPLLGYDGYYRINNLAGTFINSEIRYANYFDTRQLYVNLQRNFFTPEIKYAGGLRIETTKTVQDIVLLDTTLSKTSFNYTSYDFWTGRAIVLNESKLSSRTRTNLMFAGRIFGINYHDRPEISTTYLYNFHNRTQVLFTAAISNQGFYKSHLIYGFGKTEDIPYGHMIQLIGGYEINEFNNRPYFGVTLSQGNYLWQKGGYLFSRLELGSFFESGNNQQGLFAITAKYFTPLITSYRFKFRYFANFNYKTGIRRFDEEYVSIENQQGLIGLTSPNLKGIQKMTLNIEAVTFTPYYFWGFRFVFFGFADLGMIGPGDKSIFTNNLYSGLGVGIRLRNERLVFNTFQIRLAFYPLVPDGADWQYLQVSGEQKLKMDNFYIANPKIIDY